jgi:hypothetical protein
VDKIHSPIPEFVAFPHAARGPESKDKPALMFNAWAKKEKSSTLG